MGIPEMTNQMRADSEYWFPAWHDGTLPLPIAYALGLAGEVGEVANVIKKMHRDKSDDREIGAELADVLTYLLLLANELGVDIESEYKEKRLFNLARWGSPQGNYTWATVPVGYDVAGSGVVTEKEERNGRWYITFHRTHPFEENWTTSKDGGVRVPIGIGKLGLVFPPFTKLDHDGI